MKGNNKKERVCPVCTIKFLVSQYRIDKATTEICCSYSCSAKKRNLGTLTSISEETLINIEKEYCNTSYSLHKIADNYDISRGTIIKYAKIREWKRKTKTFSNRKMYREQATKKIGRKLEKYEQVHHIDLEDTNNEINNLFVFKNASLHTLAHKSLEYCALHFFKKGLIFFDENTGTYKLT
jgi:predicted DNA-binding protein YlxM (UPF0122 family)